MRAFELQMLTMRLEVFFRGAGLDPRRRQGEKAAQPEKPRERLAEPTAYLLAIRPR